ncbi:MAG: hypothetical protein IAC08_05500 [Bacteroidetes bacterium]|uniref:Uncharacterized protein n=1 Tax=Candidatus Cryptobacteroides intestinigallinarum TaxID=2840767 RepID=A0A9D9N0K8_9BACT|nr:hypothetical protein [Candidatus Cryptobacteroides intestinigallinarum]
MGKEDNIMTVDVKVSRPIREYVLSINDGSDLIKPERGSLLWGLIKLHLDLVPETYRPVPPDKRQDYIRIALYRTRSTRSYNVNTGRNMEVNTLFRNYLNEEGQRAVSDHIARGFKQTFRAYMGGALGNNPDLTIHDAVYEFCSDYNISMDSITYDMLRKDWYRFKKRCPGPGLIPVERQNL